MTQKGSSKKFWIISLLVVCAIGLYIVANPNLRRMIFRPPEGMFRITPMRLFPGDAAYSEYQLFDGTWASLIEHPSRKSGLSIWAELWIDGKLRRHLGDVNNSSYRGPGMEFVSLTMRKERVCPEREGDYVFRFAYGYYKKTVVLSQSYLSEIADEVWARRYLTPEKAPDPSSRLGSYVGRERFDTAAHGFLRHGETVLRPDSEAVILVGYVEMEGIYWYEGTLEEKLANCLWALVLKAELDEDYSRWVDGVVQDGVFQDSTE